jgi:hypothetical protein
LLLTCRPVEPIDPCDVRAWDKVTSSICRHVAEPNRFYEALDAFLLHLIGDHL